MAKWLIASVGAFSALGAIAQEDTRGLFSRESRFFQQEHRQERFGILSKATTPTDKVNYGLTLGLAYSRDNGGSGHTWSTPFEFAATLVDKTSLKVFGDGYARNSSAGTSASGWTDTNFAVSRPVFKDDVSSVRLGLGLKVGAGGAVGSNSESVFATASYGRQVLEQWNLGVSVKARIDINNVPAGVHRALYSGAFQVAYSLQDPSAATSVFAQLGRARRPGGTGYSFLVVGADLAKLGSWTPTISLANGLTRGARDASVELDLSTQF